MHSFLVFRSLFHGCVGSFLTLVCLASVGTASNADEVEFSPGMLDFKAALQSAFDQQSLDQLYSLIHWQGATEQTRQKLDEVFTKIMEAGHGDDVIKEITRIDDRFITEVRQFGVTVDDQGRFISPRSNDKPRTRTNLTPEYRFSFLVEKPDPKRMTTYVMFSGSREDGVIRLVVNVPLPAAEQQGNGSQSSSGD